MEKFENKQEDPKINYSDPSADDLITFLNAIEKFEDEDGELKDIPELYNGNKLNKELFAGIMMYKAPQYMLIGHESAREVNDFLKKLNEKIKNQTLEETIQYLESQIPYLDTVNDVSEKAFDDLKNIQNSVGKIEWFKNLDKNISVLTMANQANLLRVKAEVFYTNMVNKVYDKLWEEYLVSENNPNRQETLKIEKGSE